ncbi:MAG: hypothetical protein AB7F66_04645 [Bacteriovoracia bacterium]
MNRRVFLWVFSLGVFFGAGLPLVANAEGRLIRVHATTLTLDADFIGQDRVKGDIPIYILVDAENHELVGFEIGDRNTIVKHGEEARKVKPSLVKRDELGRFVYELTFEAQVKVLGKIRRNLLKIDGRGMTSDGGIVRLQVIGSFITNSQNTLDLWVGRREVAPGKSRMLFSHYVGPGDTEAAWNAVKSIRLESGITGTGLRAPVLKSVKPAALAGEDIQSEILPGEASYETFEETVSTLPLPGLELTKTE